MSTRKGTTKGKKSSHRYTRPEIEFVLVSFLRHITSAEITKLFNAKFNLSVLEPSMRYIKHKYGNDGVYGMLNAGIVFIGDKKVPHEVSNGELQIVPHPELLLPAQAPLRPRPEFVPIPDEDLVCPPPPVVQRFDRGDGTVFASTPPVPPLWITLTARERRLQQWPYNDPLLDKMGSPEERKAHIDRIRKRFPRPPPEYENSHHGVPGASADVSGDGPGAVDDPPQFLEPAPADPESSHHGVPGTNAGGSENGPEAANGLPQILGHPPPAYRNSYHGVPDANVGVSGDSTRVMHNLPQVPGPPPDNHGSAHHGVSGANAEAFDDDFWVMHSQPQIPDDPRAQFVRRSFSSPANENGAVHTPARFAPSTENVWYGAHVAAPVHASAAVVPAGNAHPTNNFFGPWHGPDPGRTGAMTGASMPAEDGPRMTPTQGQNVPAHGAPRTPASLAPPTVGTGMEFQDSPNISWFGLIDGPAHSEEYLTLGASEPVPCAPLNTAPHVVPVHGSAQARPQAQFQGPGAPETYGGRTANPAPTIPEVQPARWYPQSVGMPPAASHGREMSSTPGPARLGDGTGGSSVMMRRVSGSDTQMSESPMGEFTRQLYGEDPEALPSDTSGPAPVSNSTAPATPHENLNFMHDQPTESWSSNALGYDITCLDTQNPNLRQQYYDHAPEIGTNGGGGNHMLGDQNSGGGGGNRMHMLGGQNFGGGGSNHMPGNQTFSWGGNNHLGGQNPGGGGYFPGMPIDDVNFPSIDEQARNSYHVRDDGDLEHRVGDTEAMRAYMRFHAQYRNGTFNG